jgi:hypothetical protein
MGERSRLVRALLWLLAMSCKFLRLMLVTAMAATVAVHAAPARACSPLTAGPIHTLELAEQSVDIHAPEAPEIIAVEATEFHVSDSGCDLGRPDCGSSGGIRWVRITLRAADDRTPAAEMGYRLTGSPSALGYLGSGRDLRAMDGVISLPYSNEEPVSFDLEIRSVDLAGKVSVASSIAHVDQPGAPVGGCSVGRRAVAARWPSSVLPALALVAALVARPRRRRGAGKVKPVQAGRPSP